MLVSPELQCSVVQQSQKIFGVSVKPLLLFELQNETRKLRAKIPKLREQNHQQPEKPVFVFFF